MEKNEEEGSEPLFFVGNYNCPEVSCCSLLATTTAQQLLALPR
jgi:hypothetical protein